MQTRIRISALLLALMILGTVGTALAEITLTTDKAEYVVGEVVHITAHNAGPDEEQFNSAPFFLLYNADTEQCLFGCLGLPVITPFPVGETVSMDWNTGDSPDVPGNYTVGVAAFNGPNTSYILNEVIAAEANSWSRLKALYR